jgi:hypothetical protein
VLEICVRKREREKKKRERDRQTETERQRECLTAIELPPRGVTNHCRNNNAPQSSTNEQTNARTNERTMIITSEQMNKRAHNNNTNM